MKRDEKNRKQFCSAFTLLLIFLSLVSTARAGSWAADGSVSNQAGARRYKLWIPDRYDGKKKLPLVLMLHGCTQTAEEFAAGTGMNAVTDEHRFFVAYPEQPPTANALRCWNWFDAAHQSRGSGEPALLAEIVKQVGAQYKVDAGRVFVAGISAGGAMAVILGATYPDLFAAIGVHSGIAYKSGTNLQEGLAALARGGADANRQGQLAYQAVGGKMRRPVRVIVFQGLKDGAVAPVNADQVVTQWAQTNDLFDDGGDNDSVDDRADATTAGVTPQGYHYTIEIYRDRAGQPLIEKWSVQEMKHAWSGGNSPSSYTDPNGPHASREMWRFFSSKPAAKKSRRAVPAAKFTNQ